MATQVENPAGRGLRDRRSFSVEADGRTDVDTLGASAHWKRAASGAGWGGNARGETESNNCGGVLEVLC